MRIAHLSDLHFSHFTLSPLQFFSKRWLGNLNLLVKRKKEFDCARLEQLSELFKSLKVDLLLISGDLSTTSHPREFEKAKAFVTAVEQAGIRVIVLPGNHDQYTKRSYKKQLFYRYFPSELKTAKVAVTPLENNWFLIAIDSACATSLTSSCGFFSPEAENKLAQLLCELPKGASALLVNHYPLFNPDGSRRALIRAEHLRALLVQHPTIKLYLHGHTHRQTIADLRPNGLPIILDSGSITHKKQGSWHLLDLEKDRGIVHPYRWQNETWHKTEERRFTF